MPDTIETPVTLRLSARAQAVLLRQAQQSGKEVSELASDIIEHSVTRPPIEEIMAPVYHQVATSGMSDEDLDEFLRSELDAHRREKKADLA